MAHQEQTNERLVEKFRSTFASDDIPGFMDLLDKDCEWVLMPTGDEYIGREAIEVFARRAMSARDHTKGQGIKVTDLFVTRDRMCVEYTHHVIGTGKGDTWLKEREYYELKICLVCRLDQGKITLINEYFQQPSANMRKLFN